LAACQHRGGDRVRLGRAQKLVVEELTAAGFQIVKTVDDWPNHSYCTVFREASL
jgi:hypothetical protein